LNCCYILHSKKLNRHYIGACHDDLLQRIEKHNSQFYGSNHFTSKANDWVLSLCIDCKTYKQALRIEDHIKSMKSSVYINNLLRYPEMILKLKSKFEGASDSPDSYRG
jgi:putative endonuclease